MPLLQHKTALLPISDGDLKHNEFIGGNINGVGRYRLISKKRLDGKIEWVQYTERPNFDIANVYRWQADNQSEFDEQIADMNKHLSAIFGPSAIMILSSQ